MKVTGCLLYVRDLDRSVAFYTTALKLDLLQRSGNDVVILTDGNFELILHRDELQWTGPLMSLKSDTHRGKGMVLHFRVDDVDAWENHFRSCGHQPSYGPVSQSFGRRQCYIYDPDGYNIVVEHCVGS